MWARSSSAKARTTWPRTGAGTSRQCRKAAVARVDGRVDVGRSAPATVAMTPPSIGGAHREVTLGGGDAERGQRLAV